MARIPYADYNHPSVKELSDRIIAERGSILHLYQMLMHSGPIAEGWLKYLTAIRQKTSISGAMRELIIMRVALLNNAPYEAEQHAPIALQEGVTQDKLDALKNWPTSNVFDKNERAILSYTDSMTREIQVPESIFNEVANIYSNEEIVEITATIAAYNMVSRFLEALQIHSHDER
ncbi:carboxymuconolactone decarboxylase family protein [Comamonas jiangduensis]|uniref:carboxymuconolactone decarboxylase family protein n=1 Tax=Comamonas jiangduensis TaxID=1194168 RepID=UPI0024E17D93|nr:carboxymuconolactone decarboxylase family protein [Comamonas jiangduensis]